MIQIFDTDKDEVIGSVVALGKTNYDFALANLVPLLDRFAEQRKLQSRTFYARLKADILHGCIMPPITLAFVNENPAKLLNSKKAEDFVNQSIQSGYILDGMQRLNTLLDASTEAGFDANRPIHVNVIIAKQYDLLLYRMITLNNGQKPMTARHQIEMLTGGAIDLSAANFSIVTEKETEKNKVVGAFRKSDIVEAYTAYLTNNVNNQNKKIIESKLNDILVGRVMDSNISEEIVSFSDVLHEVGRLVVNSDVSSWMRLGNNLIGFTVGAKKSLKVMNTISPDDFAELTQKFEDAFESINASKVNVGKVRRELSRYYIENIADFLEASVDEVQTAFFDQTMSE